MTEVWKECEFPNYEVSSLGRIRNKTTGYIKHGTANPKGYINVGIYVGDYTSKTKRLHRLVAKAFVPNPDNLPEVNHINGNKTDNRACNLEWVTRKGNMEHANKNGLVRYCRKVSDKDVEYIRRNCVKNDKNGKSIRAIARELGVSHTTVKDIVNNKRWVREESNGEEE